MNIKKSIKDSKQKVRDNDDRFYFKNDSDIITWVQSTKRLAYKEVERYWWGAAQILIEIHGLPYHYIVDPESFWNSREDAEFLLGEDELKANGFQEGDDLYQFARSMTALYFDREANFVLLKWEAFE